MKVVPQASVGGSMKQHVVPPIPFERCANDTKSLQKHEYLTFKLCSVPTAADSPVYKLSVPFFNKGSCELYLITLQHLGRSSLGRISAMLQACMPWLVVSSRAMLWQLSTLLATVAMAETIAHYQQAIRALTCHVFPCQAYATQK